MLPAPIPPLVDSGNISALENPLAFGEFRSEVQYRSDQRRIMFAVECAIDDAVVVAFYAVHWIVPLGKIAKMGASRTPKMLD